MEVSDAREAVELFFKLAGAAATVGASVFAIGRLTGKHLAKDKIEAGKLIELAAELAVLKSKLESVNDCIHELEKSDLVSTQKIETLEKQMRVMFEMIDRQGEKLEGFFNKMYDLKGGG